MNDRVHVGKEHGVEWTVDESKFDPVIISAKSEKGSESVTYECNYRPIFGYDVSDTQSINSILESLIRKYATDGYTGGDE